MADTYYSNNQTHKSNNLAHTQSKSQTQTISPSKTLNNLKLTDFGSKGLYRETQGTQSQSVFKDVANLKLCGNTFDAVHMDRFLNHTYGIQPSPSTVNLTQSKNNWSSPQKMSKSLVRQSCSFTSIDREHPGQQRLYFDQYDGSSTLINRGDDFMTTKQLTNGAANIYDIEREQNSTVKHDLSLLRQMLYADSGALKSPKQRHQEAQFIKEEMRKFREEKQNYMFIGKRDKLLKRGWRHGILGVENPTDFGTQTYKEQQQERNHWQGEKEAINERRFRKYVKSHEVSEQVDFARGGQFNYIRPDKNLVEMYPDWKTKRVSDIRFMDTHQNMFIPLQHQGNPLRASKLKLEEKRDRPFNIINGETADII